jgi:CheY-like chemotaxis protein
MPSTENETQSEQQKSLLRRCPEQSAQLRASSAHSSLRGSETVLVVDDEPIVRGVIAQILQDFGYRVLEACGLLDAQRRIGTDEKINLLIADFSMPESNGLALAQWLQGRCPDLKVLLTTGELWELANQLGDQSRVAVLPKPFNDVQLLQMVQVILSTDVGLALQH